MRGLSCAEARDLASDLLDGELEPDEVVSVEAHVAACSTCPNLYLAMAALRNHFRRERARGNRVASEGRGSPGD